MVETIKVKGRKVAEKAKGWKTIIFNGAVIVGSLLVVVADAVLPVLGAADWSKILPPSGVALVTLGIGIVNAILRLRTTGPVGSKQ